MVEELKAEQAIYDTDEAQIPESGPLDVEAMEKIVGGDGSREDDAYGDHGLWRNWRPDQQG